MKQFFSWISHNAKLTEQCKFPGTFDQAEVDKFIEESLKMRLFKHAHVMGLIGVCVDAGPVPYIVMPYMANGSLLQYLKKERQNLVFTQEFDEDKVAETCSIKTHY